jgi:homoserine O-succinyltransferase
MDTLLESPVRPATDDSTLVNHNQVRRALRKSASPLRIGLVNNMPDSALVATERQFSRLVHGATPGPVSLQLFHLPAVPRQDEARAILAARYRPVSELYGSQLDALIITGNEPRAAHLDEEPYWKDLTALIDWAAGRTQTTLFSCLAAHAAVLYLDGIQRQRLPAKKSGVLACTVNSGTSRHLPEHLATCHSRLNEVRREALTQAGYTIVSETAGGHVDIFSRSLRSDFVFLQGHPEYDADSLMREYRRDVGRYLSGQRDTYPEVPENYFDNDTVLRMEKYRTLAKRSRDPRHFDTFPETALRKGLEARLRASAAAVFEHWLAPVKAQVTTV